MSKSIFCGFPGQGSQSVGMGKWALENFTYVKQIYEEASDAVGFNLKSLCLEGPLDKLTLTENTQPAIVATSSAIWTVLKNELAVRPSYLAGHSVGEYAALYAAKVLTLADAAKAVHIRGKAMQDAVPAGTGGMTALVGVNSNQVNELKTWWTKNLGEDQVLEIANLNATEQTVLSGSLIANTWVQENIKSYNWKGQAPRRVRAIPLKVSAPFHCSMMKPAEETMKAFFEAIHFSTPSYPVVQNTTAQIEEAPDTIKKNLLDQVVGSVRWVESLNFIYDKVKPTSEDPEATSLFIEVGSGSVLSGLNKKNDGINFSSYSLNSLEDFKSLESTLKA